MKKNFLIIFILLIILFITIIFSLLSGPYSIDFKEAIFGEDGNINKVILFSHRLPRTILGAIVGASLSLSGGALQAILRNPLADPYIIGVCGGGALASTIFITIGIGESIFSPLSLPLFTFAGSLISLFLIYYLAGGRGRIRNLELLLTGVIFNAFSSAIIMFIKAFVKAEKAQEMLLWLMGNLGGEWVSSTHILSCGIILFLGFSLLYYDAYSLNIITMGEEEGKTLGLNPDKVKKRVFIASSLIVSAAVSVSGLIGFVGLIVPHFVRLIFGADHRLLLPLSAILGAIFLIFSDSLVRLLFPLFYTETPVGVLTAILGSPIFVIILKKTKKY